MALLSLIDRLRNTTLDGPKTKKVLGKVLRHAFDAAEDEKTAFDVLTLAHHFDVTELDEMINDFHTEFEI